MSDWKRTLLRKDITETDIKKVTDELGIVRWKIAEDSVQYEFHQKHTKGAFLRKFEQQKYHQINWETPYYRQTLDAFLGGESTSGKVVMDFGCGDGRFTEYLIERGYDKIVCVDFDYRLLAALAEFAREKGYEDKLLLVHSDVWDLPFDNSVFDVVLTLGVLYYLNERYDEAIGIMQRLLKSKGLLITSDPDMEGFILRVLFYESLGEALNAFESRRFKEVQGETNMRFRLFNRDEIQSIFRKQGFNVEGQQGISMFHNFVRVLHARGVIPEAEIEANESRIRNLFDFLHTEGTLFKHIIWKLQRSE